MQISLLITSSCRVVGKDLPRYGRNIIVLCKLNLGATFLTPLRLRSENKHNSKIHCGSDYR